MENLPRIIAALRVHHRLSQEYVAKKLALSQGQYSKIESGAKQFPIDKLPILASILRVAPTALFECLLIGTEKPNEAIRKLVNEINNRPAEEIISEEKSCEEHRILLEYWEKKYFLLYKEYLKLCEKLNIRERLNQCMILCFLTKIVTQNDLVYSLTDSICTG